jgi:histidinol-phosphate phosphatase family protein
MIWRRRLKAEDLSIDKRWTLFLDRDGVINHKLEGDYVKQIREFEFIDGSTEAIQKLTELFGRIVIVTNQQGIGKGLMTSEDLEVIHNYMMHEIENAGGRIDKIYFCPDLEKSNSECRKPNTGMAEKARSDFPEINFKQSVMIGDSLSDIQMGKRVGMYTIYLRNGGPKIKEADFNCQNLKEVTKFLLSEK